MNVMQVFKRPGLPAYSYNMAAVSLAVAVRIGNELAEEHPEQWGEFCYSRPAAQMLLSLNEPYVLKPGTTYLRYQKEGEEMSAPLDYLTYGGSSGGEVRFPLTWTDPTTLGTVRLDAFFDAAKSFKFRDLCKAYLAKFIIEAGQPVLQFVHPYTYAVIGEITLQRNH